MHGSPHPVYRKKYVGVAPGLALVLRRDLGPDPSKVRVFCRSMFQSARAGQRELSSRFGHPCGNVCAALHQLGIANLGASSFVRFA